MNKYEVTGRVDGEIKGKCVTRAIDDVEAWENFCRAYSRHKCEIVRIDRIRPETDDDKAAVRLLFADGSARTAEDVAMSLGISPRWAVRHMQMLTREGVLVRLGRVASQTLFRAARTMEAAE